MKLPGETPLGLDDRRETAPRVRCEKRVALRHERTRVVSVVADHQRQNHQPIVDHLNLHIAAEAKGVDRVAHGRPSVRARGRHRRWRLLELSSAAMPQQPLHRPWWHALLARGVERAPEAGVDDRSGHVPEAGDAGPALDNESLCSVHHRSAVALSPTQSTQSLPWQPIARRPQRHPPRPTQHVQRSRVADNQLGYLVVCARVRIRSVRHQPSHHRGRRLDVVSLATRVRAEARVEARPERDVARDVKERHSTILFVVSRGRCWSQMHVAVTRVLLIHPTWGPSAVAVLGVHAPAQEVLMCLFVTESSGK
mmetsp:Transcript_18849/g.34086  ORF Transcript_18849/g.34086 Transcript_18849/m.34086 type:complete len:310 (-) Transcript_18849:197-1126(-)